ncbi:hypothetical protein IWX46DRAFT_664518, partial [Phyllosticta citricarpa]
MGTPFRPAAPCPTWPAATLPPATLPTSHHSTRAAAGGEPATSYKSRLALAGQTAAGDGPATSYKSRLALAGQTAAGDGPAISYKSRLALAGRAISDPARALLFPTPPSRVSGLSLRNSATNRWCLSSTTAVLACFTPVRQHLGSARRLDSPSSTRLERNSRSHRQTMTQSYSACV